jgi:protein ImuA
VYVHVLFLNGGSSEEFAVSFSVQRIEPGLDRSAVLAHLRQILPVLEARPLARGTLSFAIPAIDHHLPGGGLACGALHEFTAPDAVDMPAAFGFMVALLGQTLAGKKKGPALLALSGRSRADFGQPYGYGLDKLGVPPARLLLLETETDVQVLWALEEALRLRAVAAVASWLGGKLDLKASRRLQIAAEGSDALLLLLRPPQADESNAAATRWRVSAAPAACDRFGCFERWRWRIDLERCRNGCPGAWIVELSERELSHAAHPFGLVGTLADPALPASAEPQALRRAG